MTDQSNTPEPVPAGRPLDVLDPADPPSWSLRISPDRRRFDLVFLAGSTTPIREAVWESDGERLRCRRVVDLYYPDGDPRGRVPVEEVVSVAQRVLADGAVEAQVALPGGEVALREVVNASPEHYRVAAPALGDWEPLLRLAAPDPDARFGAAAAETAFSFCAQHVPRVFTGNTHEAMISGPRGLSILRALDDAGPAVGDARRWADAGEPVIDRGASAVFPLCVARVDVPGAVARVRELRGELQTAAIHFYGGDFFHAETSLDADEGYGRSIARAGVEAIGSMYAWRIQGRAAVLVHGVDRDSAVESLALHVIPADWVWQRPGGASTKRAQSRLRRSMRERDAADASWTWPERQPDA
ncbi:hypothetical protein [Gulosibacter sp. 10]|uniref:hypothetical protein n=1 Tax=Gulosibacter sp. 10 TaxID=1255570 RepID=UPI00097E8DB0|nr:hypothetical protein [Gulosibacter sp. 10]SJM55295.1 hypothetical protein FM112_03975 [Gulosibacter sp. 10]